MRADPEAITGTLKGDLARIGDIEGLDVIHLQCHLGTDTIGLTRLGPARVVGLDFSPESLSRARRIAQELCADIEFVEADVYSAREAIEGDFDLVYTSIGVLCWLPEVAGWAEQVASLLRPGGRLVLRDDHPMFMAISEDVTAGLKVEQPYFEQTTPTTWDSTSSYLPSTDNDHLIRNTVSHQWNHSLSEIITALLSAGMTIESFEELQHSAWCPWPSLMLEDEKGWRLRDNPERLPLQFAITATRIS